MSERSFGRDGGESMCAWTTLSMCDTRVFWEPRSGSEPEESASGLEMKWIFRIIRTSVGRWLCIN